MKCEPFMLFLHKSGLIEAENIKPFIIELKNRL